jgi:hypothetical protein
MARDYFLKSLDLYSTFPFDQGDLQSVIEIGLALSYVNLLDLDSALPYAKQAYEERLTSKGLTSTETQSAANILAPILIGLGQNLEGEKILEDSVKAALKNGLDPGSTLMVDSLNLLSFSYSLSENGKDIYALFKKPEDPPIKAPRAASLLNPKPVNTSSEEQAEDSFAKEEDTTNSSQTLDPAFNFPAALSIYNDLTKLSPQSPLRAELLRSMIEALAPATPLCKDPGDVNFRGSLWYLCVDLADSMIDAYYSPNSLSFAENLLFWREMSYENRAYLIYEILAIEKTYEGDLPSAIDYLRKALALLHNKESLSQNEQSYLILRSITLADLLLIEKNPPIESEIVLMAAINTLERTLSKKERESSLEIPFLYWYLARHLRDQSRSKDSRSNFQKAERAVTQLNKLNPDKENELQRLQTMIKDDRDYKAGKNAKEAPRFPNSPKIFYPAFLEANKNANLRTSPPSTMRIELEALKFLGRINEFQPMIDRAINQTEANSPERLRYESLKLKYLEEVGDNTGLFQELTRLYNNPQGADDSTKTLFQSSVKAYEGRVYFRQGNKSLAKSAYESALDLLSKVPGTEERQNEIRKELELITSNPKAF